MHQPQNSKAFLDFASEEEAMKWPDVNIIELTPSELSDSQHNIENAVDDEDLPDLPLEFSPIKLPPRPERPQTPEEDPNDTKFGTSAKPILYLDNCDGKKSTLVHIGGFGKSAGRENLKPCQIPAPFSPGFPPPSNDHYRLSTNGNLPEHLNGEFSYFLARCLSGIPESHGITQNHTLREQKSDIQPSLAAEVEPLFLSKKINKPQKNVEVLKPFSQKYNLLDPKCLDIEFGASSRSCDDFCRKCKEFHIAPGEPNTLPERDTCGSYIPDWHHPVNREQPWDGFMEVYSELLYWLDQDLGYDTFTEGGSFNINMYHPEHPKWRQTTHPTRGGIWICRSVFSAPQAERLCDKCHLSMIDPSTQEGLLGKKLMIEWVYYMLKFLGLQDLEVAKAIVHRMGAAKIGELVHDNMSPAWRFKDFTEFEAYYEIISHGA